MPAWAELVPGAPVTARKADHHGQRPQHAANEGGTAGARLSSFDGRGRFDSEHFPVQKLRNLILTLLYWLAFQARNVVWEIQRPTLIGVRALVVRGDEVLLIRHRSGAKPWSLPGGGVEKHERMAEAARREAFEESGVPVRVEGVLGLYDAFRGTISNYIAVFICAPLGEPNPPQSLEIAEARFFPIRALPPGTDDGTQRRVAEFLEGAMGITSLW